MVKHLLFIVVFALIAVLAYMLYVSGAFAQALPGTGQPPNGAAPQQQEPPAAQTSALQTGQQASPPQPGGTTAAPAQQKQEQKPEGVIGGILSSGKKVGRGASKAFDSVGSSGGK